jgi:hypothetical protein
MTPRDEDYAGPVRLTRKIPWGRRDAQTAEAVCKNMAIANPPIVLPWSVHEQKVKKLLRNIKLRDATLRELENLIGTRAMRGTVCVNRATYGAYRL